MRDRFFVTLACFLFVLVASQGSTREARWQLVCFDKTNLTKSLDEVVNPQQFLRNDRVMKRGSCDFVQVPSGSTARFSGFHESREGFIFPTFQIQYATTGQRMYGADGIFLSSGWRVSTKLRECIESGFRDICLVPQNCQILDGFLTIGTPPKYVAIPSSCQSFKIE